MLKASKEFFEPLLLAKNGEQNKILELLELHLLLDRYKHLSSPSFQNSIMSFRFLRRFRIMDNIRKLRGLSSWSFVQENLFFGQGSDIDKVFVFKMSEVGPGSRVDLVKRMQVGGDHKNAWIIFDHFKCVKAWTTMACHVYNSAFYRVVTIALCHMQSEDVAAKTLLWRNLNVVMARHGVPITYFKGFMANIAQANWNAVRMIWKW